MIVRVSSLFFNNPSVERQLCIFNQGYAIVTKQQLLELEIKHKHGGFNVNYEKATVVWQQFGFGS
jgi:hypothetical protein